MHCLCLNTEVLWYGTLAEEEGYYCPEDLSPTEIKPQRTESHIFLLLTPNEMMTEQSSPWFSRSKIHCPSSDQTQSLPPLPLNMTSQVTLPAGCFIRTAQFILHKEKRNAQVCLGTWHPMPGSPSLGQIPSVYTQHFKRHAGISQGWGFFWCIFCNSNTVQDQLHFLQESAPVRAKSQHYFHLLLNSNNYLLIYMEMRYKDLRNSPLSLSNSGPKNLLLMYSFLWDC